MIQNENCLCMVIDKLSAKIKPLLFFSKFSQGWCPFFLKGLFNVDCENAILKFYISLGDVIFFSCICHTILEL